MSLSALHFPFLWTQFRRLPVTPAEGAQRQRQKRTQPRRWSPSALHFPSLWRGLRFLLCILSPCFIIRSRALFTAFSTPLEGMKSGPVIFWARANAPI